MSECVREGERDGRVERKRHAFPESGERPAEGRNAWLLALTGVWLVWIDVASPLERGQRVELRAMLKPTPVRSEQELAIVGHTLPPL